MTASLHQTAIVDLSPRLAAKLLGCEDHRWPMGHVDTRAHHPGPRWPTGAGLRRVSGGDRRAAGDSAVIVSVAPHIDLRQWIAECEPRP
jgi:hypothetical protein